MTETQWPLHALARVWLAGAALVGACAGDEGPDPATVSLEFCGAPDWVAFQDGTGRWQHLVPTAGNTYEASLDSDRGGIAWASVNPQFGDVDVHVRYGLTEELGLRCWPGSAQVNGTVTAIAETEEIAVSLANSHAFLHGQRGLTSFALRDVPAGTWNLLAVREDPSVANPPPRIIIRRGVAVSPNGELASLDFEGPEAFEAASVQLTITGLSAPIYASAGSDFYDGDGWMNNVGLSSVSETASASFAAIPPDRLAADELSAVWVAADDELGWRETYSFFRTPVQAVEIGPVLTRPDITYPNVTPYLRPVARLRSQPEYERLALVDYSQGGRSASVEVTAAYLGGTPATWQLELPDFSGVDGWNNSWGLDPAAPPRWYVEAQGGVNPFVRAPLHEGDRYRAAYQTSDDFSSGSARMRLRQGR